MVWSLVAGQAASVNGATVTLAGTPVSGNLVAVGVVVSVTSGTVTCADGLSAALTKDATNVTGSSTVNGFMFHYVVPGSPSKSFIATTVGGTGSIQQMFAAEFTQNNGTITTGTVVETSSTASNAAGANPISTPSITPTNSGDLGVNLCCLSSTLTGYNSPVTILASVTGGNGMGYQVDAASAAMNPGGNNGGGGNWDSLLVLFKLPSGAPASPGPLFDMGDILVRRTVAIGI